MGAILLLSFWAMAGMILLRAAVGVVGTPAGSSAQSLKVGELTVGLSGRVFPGVNRNDAEAALKAYLVSVGRQRGYDLTPHMQFFNSASDFEAAIRGGQLQLSIIPPGTTWTWTSRALPTRTSYRNKKALWKTGCW